MRPTLRSALQWLAVLVSAAVVLVVLCIAPTGCKKTEREVVVYVSVDQSHAEAVLAAFERDRGIKVRPVFDVEANKAAGLARRILAERATPRADVFWNGELVQTLMLSRAGVLAPYLSPSAKDLPDDFVDPQGHWAGCAGRVRVMMVLASLPAEQQPTSILDFVGDKVPADQMGLSLPLFGTGATHAAALYAELGPERALDFYKRVHQRGVDVADGNSTVRDRVVRGKLRFGMVDTDDACEAVKRGEAVRAVLPDQGQDQMGALVIPTTVALVQGGPHPVEGKALVDYLLSAQTEGMLVSAGWSHAPARKVDATPPCFSFPTIKRMRLKPRKLAEMVDRSRDELRSVFLR